MLIVVVNGCCCLSAVLAVPGLAPVGPGGMLVGPGHPMFGAPGRGGMYPAGAPPGARFDPFSPFGPGGPRGPRGPPGPSNFYPNPDHMRPPW